MVYVLEDSDRITEGFEEEQARFLSGQRREAIGKYRSARDRINGCAVYMLLRYALIKEYGYCRAPVFRFGEHGKPYLADREDIFFNMSHCKNAVCCIVSDKETAIDITDMREVRPAVIRRVCSEAERQIIKESAEPQRAFLKMWTRKECLSKLSGRGMSQPFIELTDELSEAAGLHTVVCRDHIYTYYSSAEEKTLTLPDEGELVRFLRENAR